jgi:fimbrial isopeptide formation D2 family protein/LPXTG-motif cell wall-anchored protein
MKATRKLLALLLALLLTAALTVPALANGDDGTDEAQPQADTTYTITIENNKPGHTYEAYQVFAGDLAGSVLSNIQWGTGVNGAGLLAALKEDTTIGSNFTDCTTAAQVAEVLTKKFDSDSDDLNAFAVLVNAHLAASATGTSGAISEEKYTISGLPAGYYLLKDQDNSLDDSNSAYTMYMLQLVGNLTTTPKASAPTVEKKVQENTKVTKNEGYGTGYNDVADWNIGDAVPFKLIGALPAMSGYDTYKYVFHDTLSAGLTLNADSVEVYVTATKDANLESATKLTATTDYTLITSNTGDGCSFEVVFSNLTEVTIPEGSEYIIVAYTATLNKNAEIGLDGNPNEVYLEFSNNPYAEEETNETPKDTVIVFTYELDTTKVDGGSADPENPAKLPDAQFVLLNSDGTKVAKIDAANKFDGWVELPEGTGEGGAITYEDWTTCNKTNPVILTSDDDGLFKVIGLDDGTYKLREIQAPDGFNLLPNDVEVVITADTNNGQDWTSGMASEALTDLNVTADKEPGNGQAITGIAAITIENNKGATLPETGGMGTTVFYVLGGILAVGAGVLLVARRRMRGER